MNVLHRRRKTGKVGAPAQADQGGRDEVVPDKVRRYHPVLQEVVSPLHPNAAHLSALIQHSTPRFAHSSRVSCYILWACVRLSLTKPWLTNTYRQTGQTLTGRAAVICTFV